MPAKLNIFIVFLITAFLIELFPPNLIAQQRVDWEAFPDYIKERNSFQRIKHFYQQREFLDGTLPLNTYWEARDAEVRRWGDGGNLRTLDWEAVGPAGIISTWPPQWGVNSGRCRGLAVHPFDPNIAYIGAAAGGIWRTTDGGESWEDIGYSLESLTFGAIAIDPVEPNIIYAGTGEVAAFSNSTLFDGRGMFKSTDGGDSWEHIDAFGTQTHFGDIAVSPHDNSVVLAVLGSGYARLGDLPNEGLWRSEDGGETWDQVIAEGNGFDLLWHPAYEGVVYATVGSRFYYSDDFGQSWTRRTTGMASGSRIQIDLHYTEDVTTIYAVLYNGSTLAFKSTDEGENWTQISEGVPLGGNYGGGWFDQGWYDLSIGVDPSNPDHVLIGNVEIHRTIDGENFSPVRTGGQSSAWDSPMHVDYHKIVFSPSNPNVIYVGSDGGVFRSTDGGTTWHHRNNGINTVQYYRMASHPTDPLFMIGGAQDNGNYRTLDGGATPWGLVTTGDGMECFIDHTEPNWVYMATQNGNLMRSSQGGAFSSFQNISIGNGAWTAPYFMHPTVNTTIYSATNRPYVSYDRGDTWQPMGDLTLGTVTAFAQSRANPNHLMVGNATSVFLTTDHGETWSNNLVNRPGLPDNSQVSRLFLHPVEENTLFIVYSSFAEGEKLFRSTDLGVTWENVSGDLPNVPANDVFIPYNNPLVWFVANDLGVYTSEDSGQTWVRETGLPYVPAIDFDYFSHETTHLIRIGTHGRGAFQAELPIPSGIVRGTVVDESGEPISGVRIQSAGTFDYFQTTTDDQGFYELPQVLEGTYTLTASKFAYADAVSEEFTITVDEEVIIDFEMSLLPTGTLNGSVIEAYTATPQPLSGVEVAVVGTPLIPVLTGDDGQYQITNIPIGEYTVQAINYDYLSEQYHFTMTAGAEVTRDFELIPIYSFEEGPGEYQVDGLWEWGQPQSSGGPDYAYHGDNLFGTDLDGMFTGPDSMNLFTSSYTLEADDPPYELSFYHWLECLRNWSGGQVQISTDQGDTWELIYPEEGYDFERVVGLGQTPGYTSAEGEWRFAQFDLSDYAGEEVMFRFWFGAYARPQEMRGWFIDHLVVKGQRNLGIVSVQPEIYHTATPQQYDLAQNYPNPFNPKTTIRFALPQSERVQVQIYDIQGRLIRTLLDEVRESGYHAIEWDGTDAQGSVTPSGVYLYRLQTSTWRQTKSMVLLR
ncbi:MAG: T9SS C-terminal target domain-containing protein [Gemmatimonadetes bacterium]|nr:MAG: T9SS C-terminal target domain-containing protein [Gemmatimonadota bacterium]